MTGRASPTTESSHSAVPPGLGPPLTKSAPDTTSSIPCRDGSDQRGVAPACVRGASRPASRADMQIRLLAPIGVPHAGPCSRMDPDSRGPRRLMSDERVAEAALMQALQGAQEGDEEALGVLLERLLPLARSWCVGRLRDPGLTDLVDDVVQETGVRIIRHVRKCRASSAGELVSWVLTIAHRESSRALDRHWMRYRAILETDLVHRGDQPGDLERSKRMRQMAALLSAAYAQLPQGTQKLIYLRLMEGMSWAEVGLQCHCTAAAAKRRYQRALARLRKEVAAQARQSEGPDVVIPMWLA